MKVYDLVFEGGGAKGMVFVGALEVFEKQDCSFGRVLGTSAGAISATLLAAGYTVSELLEALNEQEDGQPIFATFMGQPTAFTEDELEHSATLALLRDIDLPFIGDRIEEKLDMWLARILMEKSANLFSLIERGGWYSAHRFVEWLSIKLDAKSTDPANLYSHMTLLQFYEATGRELSVVTSDTVGQRMLVLNHRTAPNLPVVWAVRMSMSIPMIWPEVEWRPEWGSYYLGGNARDIVGHTMVDGGLLSNFPIELFLSDAPKVTGVMGSRKGNDVLGLMIDEKMPVLGAEVVATSDQGGVKFG